MQYFVTKRPRLTRSGARTLARACDLFQNHVFSLTAVTTAAWSAEVSKLRDAPSEAGNGFNIRFGRRFVQNAAKSVGGYVGAMIAREDPRAAPPYLAMKTTPPPAGFVRRVRHALASNLLSYACRGDCSQPDQITRRPALSHVAGALASGYASEAWAWDRRNSSRRALRGAATAYGASFLNALANEFKPELSAAAAKTIRAIFAPK